MAVSSTLRRRRLAAQLRELRESRRMTLEDAAVRIEISKSALSRIENAKAGVRVPVVRALLQTYGVDDRTRDALVELARQANRRDWWHQYRDAAAWSPGLAEFLSLEDEATERLHFAMMLVPGLLQTGEYAEAVLREHSPGAPKEIIDKRVELRISRQPILHRARSQESWFVIDESALRRLVGGRSVMADQLRHLLDLCATGKVNIQVLPFGAGAYPAMENAFTVLRFRDDPSIVHIELTGSAIYLENPDEVQRYSQAFNHLRAAAASLRESATTIERILKEHLC